METELQEETQQQKDTEKQVEELHQKQNRCIGELHQKQAEYYEIAGEIAILEQNIDHERTFHRQSMDELRRLELSIREAEQYLASDKKRLHTVEEKLHTLSLTLQETHTQWEIAQLDVQKAQTEFFQWQSEWEKTSQELLNAQNIRDMQHARIEERQRQAKDFNQHIEDTKRELVEIEHKMKIMDQDLLEQQLSHTRKKIHALQSEVDQKESDLQRQQQINTIDTLQQDEISLQHQTHDLKAQLNSLQLLQQAGQENESEQLSEWLKRHQLLSSRRLVEIIHVEKGWEEAVDIVLGHLTHALVVDSIEKIQDYLPEITEGIITICERVKHTTDNHCLHHLPLLTEKIEVTDITLKALLGKVYCAPSLSVALAARAKLRMGESIVCRDGSYLGMNWLRHGHKKDSVQGKVQLQANIISCSDEVAQLEEQLRQSSQRLQQANDAYKELQSEYNRDIDLVSEKTLELNTLFNKLSATRATITEMVNQQQRLQRALQQWQEGAAQSTQEISTIQQLSLQAEHQLENFSQQRDQSMKNKACLQQAQESRQEAEGLLREQYQQSRIEFQKLDNLRGSLEENIQRTQKQLNLFLDRHGELTGIVERQQPPDEEMQQKLTALQNQKVTRESAVRQAKILLTEVEERIANASRDRLRSSREWTRLTTNCNKRSYYYRR